MEKVQWLEPPRFRRAALKAAGHRYDVKFGLAFSAGFALLVLVAVWFRQNPVNGSWLLTVLVALSPGLLIMGILPAIDYFMSNKIVLSSNGLTRSVSRGGNVEMQQIAWDQIVSARQGRVELDGVTFDVLIITSTDGTEFPVATTAKTDFRKVRDLFAAHDRPIELSPEHV